MIVGEYESPDGASEINLPPGSTFKTDIANLEKAVHKGGFEVVAAETAAAQAAAPKRGRGRPRKIKSETARPSVGATESVGAAPSVDTQNVDLSKVTAAILKMPFDVAAARSGVDEVRCTDKEIEEPAVLASELVNIYMPALANADPKLVVAYSFATALGMLVYSKFVIYKIKKKEIEPAAVETRDGQKPSEDPAAVPVLKSDSIDAADAFRPRGSSPFQSMNF